jgi:RNA polymerase sigma-70 factor (ECF subfamily)
MANEDDQLAAQCLAGDAAALRRLVETYHGAMMRLARAIVGDAIAEEVVQEAWLKALGALAGFEGRSALKPWLLAILRNHALSRLRVERRTIASGDATEVETAGWFLPDGHWRESPQPWASETPESLLAAKELKAALEAAYAALPPLQRAVLGLRDMDDLPLAEICNILDLNAPHVRVLLHRSRRALWHAVAQKRKEER